MSEKQCRCRQCLRDRNEGTEIAPGIFIPAEAQQMILCQTCGNKRCPHATDHRHACTGSNEPGQAGSAYEGCKPHNVQAQGQPEAVPLERHV